MSDLLEPFRRAAELGSEDFYICGKDLTFRANFGIDIDLPCVTEGEPSNKRINRYAAAVCECWWREHEKENTPDECYQHLDCVRDATSEIRKDAQRMIDLCREFGRKHGGQ